MFSFGTHTRNKFKTLLILCRRSAIQALYSEYFDENHPVVVYGNLVPTGVLTAVRQNNLIQSVIARYMLRSSWTYKYLAICEISEIVHLSTTFY
jgi:hypothetical protein